MSFGNGGDYQTQQNNLVLSGVDRLDKCVRLATLDLASLPMILWWWQLLFIIKTA